MLATAPPAPYLEPTATSSQPLSCCICLGYVPEAMLSHGPCFQLICAKDAKKLLDGLCSVSRCPTCRGQIREDPSDPSSLTRFIRPTPTERHFMDQIDFECPACGELMKVGPARLHRPKCPGETIRQPPAPVPPRQLQPLSRIEITSNPPCQRIPNDRSRLVIMNLDGKQIWSKQLKSNETIARLKSRLANLTGGDVAAFKLFKFDHRELGDNETIGEIHNSGGAAHFTAFNVSNHRSTEALNNCVTHLILDEIGPTPTLDPAENEWW